MVLAVQVKDVADRLASFLLCMHEEMGDYPMTAAPTRVDTTEDAVQAYRYVSSP